MGRAGGQSSTIQPIFSYASGSIQLGGDMFCDGGLSSAKTSEKTNLETEAYMSRNASGKTVARFFAVLIAVPTLMGPTRAAESNTPIPDLSGLWARNSFAYETPRVGFGPVENASRLPSGARDRTMLVGDYANPILTPNAAQVVKR